MSSLFDSAKFVMSVADIEGLPDSELPEIAFAGRSNAGNQPRSTVFAASPVWHFPQRLRAVLSF